MPFVPSFLAISAAIYDPIEHSVTLVPADRLLALRASYRLTVIGTGPLGVTDSTGALLDGLNNNKPGSNYVKVFSQHYLSGPSRIFTLPTTLADLQGVPGLLRPTPAAVDALMVAGGHHFAHTTIAASYRRHHV